MSLLNKFQISNLVTNLDHSLLALLDFARPDGEGVDVEIGRIGVIGNEMTAVREEVNRLVRCAVECNAALRQEHYLESNQFFLKIVKV